MNRTSPLLSKQCGAIKFWQVMLIILFFVGLALFINARGTGFFTQTIPNSLGFNTDQNYADYRNYSHIRVRNTSYERDPEDTDADIPVDEPQTANRSPVQQRVDADNTYIEYNDNLYTPDAGQAYGSYDQQFPQRLSRGYYTVQVFTGYNSKEAYDLRSALKNDGYSNAHIREIHTSHGVLFKVRIGRFHERYEAFAVRDQVLRRYPKKLNSSFVMLVEREYN